MGESIQPKENRGGIIVDDGSRFRAGQLDEQSLNHFFTLAAFAGRQIILQIDRIAGHRRHGIDRRLGQQGAAQVGVEDRAGGVDHANVPRHTFGADDGFNSRDDCVVLNSAALSCLISTRKPLEHVATLLRDVITIVAALGALHNGHV